LLHVGEHFGIGLWVRKLAGVEKQKGGKMKEKVKIVAFEAEAFKRLKVVRLEPSATGLTVIGGNNRQGKSSILDAIMSALGGEKYTPSKAVNAGADKAKVELSLSNGLKVTRTYTEAGTYLKIDDNGKVRTGGQSLLNKLIAHFALNISAFLAASDKEKANTLLEIIGVDLKPIDARYDQIYQRRLSIGQLRDKAKGHAESLPYHEGLPEDLITPTAIMETLKDKLGINAKNRELRANVGQAEQAVQTASTRLTMAQDKVKQIEDMLAKARADVTVASSVLAQAMKNHETAISTAEFLEDEDVSALEQEIKTCDETNAKIRENMEREKAFAEVEGYREEYISLDRQIEAIRKEKAEMLAKANLPLPGLSVENGTLTFNGIPWDGMSHSEQLITSTAIVRAINPTMGFVLLDKVEAMDVPTLDAFGKWLESEGLQAICTRVSTGDECSLIIEDGQVKEVEF